MRRQIDSRIQLIELPGFHYANCNCLLIEDDMRCLIDSGCDDSELESLRQAPVHLVVNSHGHSDHCRHNHVFSDARVLMHPDDHAIASSGDAYLKEMGLESLTGSEWADAYLNAVQYRPSPIHGSLEDGQAICTGACTFQVLHMPGHSAGHCCFFFPEQGFVFTSDIEFSDFGPWYGNLRSSVSDTLNSLDRLAAIGADYYISGHGTSVVRDPDGSILRQYRNRVLERQRRVAELLYSGHSTAESIARELPVYRRLPWPKEIFWIHELVMVGKHLEYLEEQGYAILDGNGWHPGKTLPGPAHLSL